MNIMIFNTLHITLEVRYIVLEKSFMNFQINKLYIKVV